VKRRRVWVLGAGLLLLGGATEVGTTGPATAVAGSPPYVGSREHAREAEPGATRARDLGPVAMPAVRPRRPGPVPMPEVWPRRPGPVDMPQVGSDQAPLVLVPAPRRR
jgi:hypothetical protein